MIHVCCHILFPLQEINTRSTVKYGKCWQFLVFIVITLPPYNMCVGHGEIICSLSHFLNYYLMVVVYLRLLYLFSWYIMYIPAMYTSLHIYQYSTLYYVSLFLIFCFLHDFKHVHSFIGDNFLISPLIVSNQTFQCKYM